MIHGYRLHQMQGNQIYGFRKSGYLLKKSEGKMRVKAWRKRRCEIIDGFLKIYHSDETQPPTKLNLLTCQVKLVPGKEKKCFDLISYNRTYHFQVEDEHDITAWVYVLINCKEGALKRQFDDPNSNSKDFVDFASDQNTTVSATNDLNNSTASSPTSKYQQNDETIHQLRAEKQLQQQLIKQVQALTGNDRCVDCSTTKDLPTWLSTNLGVLVCIECSGIHRDLGVHVSRIQSLTLDNINTSQLLIAHNMGNDFFNEIFEAKLRQLELLAADIASPNSTFDTPRLKPNSSMEQRCEFIRTKYLLKKFCQNIHRDDLDRRKSLKQAVISKDLKKLVQLYGEGFDIASCISDTGDNYNNDNNHHHNHDHQQHVHKQPQVNSSLISPTPPTSEQSSDNNHKLIGEDVVNTPPKSPHHIDQDTSIHLALSCQASRENASVQFECDLFILDFIIQNSRAINKQNSSGETPLHYAAKYNLPECMKLLLRSGADVNIRNFQGESPLDVVKKAGYLHLIDVLSGSQ